MATTVIDGYKNCSFTYMVDSGADQSMIHETVVKHLNDRIQPVSQHILGMGGNTIKTLGTILLYVRLAEITALATAGFSLNLNKCRFFQTKIEYLGSVVQAGTIRPSCRKIDALALTVPPTNVKGLHQLLGLADYFRRYIRGFAELTAPLTRLLQLDISFAWTTEHEQIRRRIISKLVQQPVLQIFNPGLTTELYTDASSVGLGAALMQVHEGRPLPVAYFSRQTNEHETKWHSYDLETLALVEAIEDFCVYLYSIHFILYAYTNCNSVRATALKKDLHPRVARWWMRLQDYDFEIQYRPGCKMGHVDYLSRNPVVVVQVSRKTNIIKSVPEHQSDDVFCQSLRETPNVFTPEWAMETM